MCAHSYANNFVAQYYENDTHDGEIYLILGPMFSGKTTELLRLMRRYVISDRKCLLLKHSKDDRYERDRVVSHDGSALRAVPVTNLTDFLYEPRGRLNIDDYDIIGIDEGQFFKDIVIFSETMANRGKIVIIASLDGTFNREPFNDILNLIPKAEHVKKLKSICHTCKKDGSFTSKISLSDSVEDVGDLDKYRSSCRKCYFVRKTSRAMQRISQGEEGREGGEITTAAA